MARYFFDIQSGRDFFLDESGMDLPNHNAAALEAMRALSGMIRDSVFVHGWPDMAIEVRSASEHLFCAALIYRTTGTLQ